MSLVHYKFRAHKDYNSVIFDGLGISVFDLKREIVIQQKMQKADNFDLVLSNAETGEEFEDDNAVIQRNSSILVKRVPCKLGRGAQRYVNGVAPTPVRNQNQSTNIIRKPPNIPPTSAPSINNQSTNSIDSQNGQGLQQSTEASEEEKIANMFRQTTEHWEKEQEKMATGPYVRRPRPTAPPSSGANAVPSSTTNGNAQNQQNRTPPSNYVCFRCGQRGHFIYACPTIGDKSFNHPKVKRTTGIPKSFLKVVDAPPEGNRGVMITPDGTLVVARANDAEWEKFNAKASNYVESEDILDNAVIPAHLKCFICNSLAKEIVKTTCCQLAACYECIVDSLTQTGANQSKCPNCHQDLYPDQLISDPSLRKEVDDYVREYAAKRKEALRSGMGHVGSLDKEDEVIADNAAGVSSEDINKVVQNETRHDSFATSAASPSFSSIEKTSGQSIETFHGKRTLDSDDTIAEKRFRPNASEYQPGEGSRVIPVVNFTDREQQPYSKGRGGRAKGNWGHFHTYGQNQSSFRGEQGSNNTWGTQNPYEQQMTGTFYEDGYNRTRSRHSNQQGNTPWQ